MQQYIVDSMMIIYIVRYAFRAAVYVSVAHSHTGEECSCPRHRSYLKSEATVFTDRPHSKTYPIMCMFNDFVTTELCSDRIPSYN